MQRDFKGVWIPREIWLNKELDLTEKALLIEIDSLDSDEVEHCIASNEYFAEFLNCSVSKITRSIKHLKELGFIEEICFDGRTRKLRVVKMTKQSSQNDVQLTSISSNTNIYNNYKDTKNISIIEEESKKENNKITAKQFVDDYNRICKSLPKCIRMTPGRSRAISKILKTFSYAEIIQVFENLENSDFCKGKNDRGWTANIDFILREDKFIAVLEGKYNSSSKRSGVEKMVATKVNRVSDEERERIKKYGTKF